MRTPFIAALLISAATSESAEQRAAIRDRLERDRELNKASCTLHAPNASYDLSPLGFLHARVGGPTAGGTSGIDRWQYFADVCAPPGRLAGALPACAGATHGFAVVQIEGGACHVLGARAGMKLSPLPPGELGVQARFVGGDACGARGARTTLLRVTCTSAAPSFFSFASSPFLPLTRAPGAPLAVTEVAPCSYEMRGSSPAACPLECGRGADGAVCSGRGECVVLPGGKAGCVCAEGAGGAHCRGAAETAPLQQQHEGVGEGSRSGTAPPSWEPPALGAAFFAATLCGCACREGLRRRGRATARSLAPSALLAMGAVLLLGYGTLPPSAALPRSGGGGAWLEAAAQRSGAPVLPPLVKISPLPVEGAAPPPPLPLHAPPPPSPGPLPLQLRDVFARNEATRSSVKSWVERRDWDAPPSLLHFGVPSMAFPWLSLPVGPLPISHDLISLLGAHLKQELPLRPLQVLEIGVAVGRCLFTQLQFFGGAAVVTGFDVEDINPTLARLVTEAPPLLLDSWGGDEELGAGVVSVRRAASGGERVDGIHQYAAAHGGVLRYVAADARGGAAWTHLARTNVTFDLLYSDAFSTPEEALLEGRQVLQRGLLSFSHFAWVWGNCGAAVVKEAVCPLLVQLRKLAGKSSSKVHFEVVKIGGWLGDTDVDAPMCVASTLNIEELRGQDPAMATIHHESQPPCE